MHIRADVTTKTIGKSRDDKKSSYGSTLPKAHRKKSPATEESKECFSENDTCYVDDYECDYDYEYDDEYDEDEDEDENDDSDGATGGRRFGDREETTGLAAAVADNCGERRGGCARTKRRDRRAAAAAANGGRRDPSGDGRRRRASREKATRAAKVPCKAPSADAAVSGRRPVPPGDQATADASLDNDDGAAGSCTKREDRPNLQGKSRARETGDNVKIR